MMYANANTYSYSISYELYVSCPVDKGFSHSVSTIQYLLLMLSALE